MNSVLEADDSGIIFCSLKRHLLPKETQLLLSGFCQSPLTAFRKKWRQEIESNPVGKKTRAARSCRMTRHLWRDQDGNHTSYWEQFQKLESLQVWERKTLRKVWSGGICSFLKKMWTGWLAKWVCIFPKEYHFGQGKRRPPITLHWRETCEFCSPKLKAFVEAPSLSWLWSLSLSWPWK